MLNYEAGIVIIGAGIAGLSTAYHLKLPSHIYEREIKVGGLCRTEEMAGCTFDYAPKLILMGDKYATDLSSELLGDNVDFIVFRDWSYHYDYDVFTRLPIQKHLYGLPLSQVIRALAGLVKAKIFPNGKNVKNYKEWLYQRVGRPMADMLIIPQEQKKWKIDPVQMDYRWAPSRVTSPDLKTALHGAFKDIPHTRRFGYPREGGIGALMDAFASHLENIHLGVSLTGVDTQAHVAYFDDGSQQPYTALVPTLPLPVLVKLLDQSPPEIEKAAEELQHLSLQCVCLVVEKERLSDKHFVYVHHPDIIFHRLSFLSNLSTQMAPPGYSSLLAEVSYVDQPLDEQYVIECVQNDLIKCNFLRSDDNVVASRILDIPYAYPRQTPNRIENVRRIHTYLNQFDIYPIGRFAEWEYYNMHDIIPRSRDLATQLEARYGKKIRSGKHALQALPA